jgi:hypothetical protein
MKFYLSPLFFLSALLLLMGVVYYVDSLYNPQHWSGVVAILAFFYGSAAMLLHLICWLLLKKKARVLLLLEFALIVIAFLIYILNAKW